MFAGSSAPAFALSSQRAPAGGPIRSLLFLRLPERGEGLAARGAGVVGRASPNERVPHGLRGPPPARRGGSDPMQVEVLGDARQGEPARALSHDQVLDLGWDT